MDVKIIIYDKHIPSGFSVSTILWKIKENKDKDIENKNDVFRGKDSIKKFCEPFRDYTMKKTDFKKKNIEVINKRKTVIIQKCKNLLYLWRISKNGEEITKAIPYRLKSIDNARFMTSSLSNLPINVAEGIHKIKCKYGHNNKNCKTCWIKYKDCKCCLEYPKVKNNLIQYKSLSCNKNNRKLLIKI